MVVLVRLCVCVRTFRMICMGVKTADVWRAGSHDSMLVCGILSLAFSAFKSIQKYECEILRIYSRAIHCTVHCTYSVGAWDTT